MVERHAHSQHEDKAEVTEQELSAAAHRMIQDYLAGRLSRVDAGHLINELEHLLELLHSNPDRISCPGMELLTRLTNGGHVSESNLLHVKRCAQCFRECTELLNRKLPRDCP